MDNETITRPISEVADTILRYLVIVLTDGDWLNDWLTHLPTELIAPIRFIGWYLSWILNL